jgi:hypothetical protein
MHECGVVKNWFYKIRVTVARSVRVMLTSAAMDMVTSMDTGVIGAAPTVGDSFTLVFTLVVRIEGTYGVTFNGEGQLKQLTMNKEVST